jgi:hypothetical protein
MKIMVSILNDLKTAYIAAQPLSSATPEKKQQKIRVKIRVKNKKKIKPKMLHT